jgi:hypothetical protein
VLTAYRWERKTASADEFSVVEGEDGRTLTFEAAVGDHGTEYRVTAMTPNGLVGYGPSPATALTVTEADEEPGTEEPGTEEPGSEEPGSEEPGTEEPGATVPEGRPTDAERQGSPSPEGRLAATGSAGVPLLVGGALLLTLGGGFLIAVRGRALRRAD